MLKLIQHGTKIELNCYTVNSRKSSGEFFVGRVFNIEQLYKIVNDRNFHLDIFKPFSKQSHVDIVGDIDR